MEAMDTRELIKINARPKLKEPNLIAAWPGVSSVALITATYLLEKLPFKDLAEIRPMYFFEPIGVLARNNIIEAPSFPQSRFFYYKNPTGPNDIILFIGDVQPTAKAYDMANAILDIGTRFRMNRVYTCAAAMTKMHHTEQPIVRGVGTNLEMAEELELLGLGRGGHFQISGLNGLLLGVAAMGVYPYITSTIVMQLMTPVIPKLQLLAQEGEAGRNKINLYTHLLTVPLAAFAGYGQLALLQANGAVASTDGLTTAAIIIAMVGGTLFLVWLGEQITQYGIGNGVSIIIFAGIISGIPGMVGEGILAGGQGQVLGLVSFIVIVIATTTLIVLFTEAHRRIPVQYAKSVIKGGKMYRQSGSTYIPLRVNTAGMIPLIFSKFR
jgi:proteasome assembly chaperone (PAC2) family protein